MQLLLDKFIPGMHEKIDDLVIFSLLFISTSYNYFL